MTVVRRVPRWRSLGLRAKLLFYFVAVVLASTVLSVNLSTQLLQKRLQDRELQRLDDRVQGMERLMEEFARQALSYAGGLAQGPIVAEALGAPATAPPGADHGGLAPYLAAEREALGAKAGIDILDVYDAEGRALGADMTASPRSSPAAPFARALRGEESALLTRWGGRWALIAAAPARRRGAVVGVVAAGYLISDAFAQRISRVVGADLAFFDDHGTVVAANPELREQSHGLVRMDGLAADVLRGAKVDFIGPSRMGPALFTAAYHTLREPDGSTAGVMFIGIPRGPLEADLSGASWQALLVGIPGLALAAVLAVIVSTGFTRPLEALKARMEAVAEACFVGDIRVEGDYGQDEIGTLARVFNEMGRCLADAYAGLEQQVAARTAELTQANAEIRRQNAELERANHLKSEFLANMSHELRTPLNAIIGFSELLLHQDRAARDPEEEQAYLEGIYSSGKHLLGLINDVLDLSKIEAGKMTLTLEEVELADVVAGVEAVLGPLAAKKSLTLGHDLPDLPAVRTDVAKLKQVLYNLISNAIKFTPEGGTVQVGARRVGDCVEIWVRDSGIGIHPDDHARIFEEFQQVDASYTREQGGTGLGLALTRRLVELLGGRIWLTSQVGQGSTFTFTLPAACPEALPERAPAPAWAATGPPRVLVVDDDPQARQILARHLRDGGYEVSFARDGADAVDKARQLHPDVITLDVMLPKLDGWEVLPLLKQQPDTAGIPVVVVTIVDDSGTSLALGADSYLQKPVGREDLLQAIRRLCQPSGRGRRVLVVDDDPDDRQLIAAMLRDAGYEVVEAAGGHEAIALAVTAQPDLVVLDLMMPDASGFDVAAALGQDPRTRDVPIALCTARSLSEDDRERLNGFIRAVVQKGTVGREDLLLVLERVLRHSGASRERAHA